MRKLLNFFCNFILFFSYAFWGLIVVCAFVVALCGVISPNTLDELSIFLINLDSKTKEIGERVFYAFCVMFIVRGVISLLADRRIFKDNIQ